MNFSAVILAGGRSTRMGRDKAWLEIGGQPLLAQGRLAVSAFAGDCVQSGLARFVELPASQAGCFANWNSPADLPCRA